MAKILKNNYIMVAVSGGPDSIFLITKLLKKYQKIIVIHINYHFRKESNEESEFVKLFCKKNNLIFESLSVNEEIKNKYQKINKNQEAFARLIRYDFFKKISKKYHTNNLFLGHHKDDFLETAIMQEKRSNKYLFFGIAKKSTYQNLILIRPFINKYWKEEIIEKLNKNSIDYKIDKSNFSDKYLRNQIRKDLFLLSIKEKEKIFRYYISLNKANEFRRRKIEKIFKSWKNSNFEIEFFNKQNINFKEALIYKYLSTEFIDKNISINKNKMEAIINFLNNNRGDKNYRIKSNIFLKIKDKKLIIFSNDLIIEV